MRLDAAGQLQFLGRSDHQVKLLANLLPRVAPGALLAADRGEADWPYEVYRLYWPVARADSFAATA